MPVSLVVAFSLFSNHFGIDLLFNPSLCPLTPSPYFSGFLSLLLAALPLVSLASSSRAQPHRQHRQRATRHQDATLPAPQDGPISTPTQEQASTRISCLFSHGFLCLGLHVRGGSNSIILQQNQIYFQDFHNSLKSDD